LHPVLCLSTQYMYYIYTYKALESAHVLQNADGSHHVQHPPGYAIGKWYALVLIHKNGIVYFSFV